MLAADTNVVLRVLVQDDVAQQRAAHRRLERALAAAEPVLLSDVVLAETSWVLESVYEYGRAQVSDALRALVSTPPFFVPDRTPVLAALDAYDSGKASFSDYLIVALAEEHGATRVLTFDRRLLKHPACEKP